jgi:hypothetical protein
MSPINTIVMEAGVMEAGRSWKQGGHAIGLNSAVCIVASCPDGCAAQALSVPPVIRQ